MSVPSAKQLSVLIGLSANKLVSRDDTDTPARWFYDGKRLNYDTARVLYCRGWIEKHASTGLITLFKISESGRAALGSGFAINTTKKR